MKRLFTIAAVLLTLTSIGQNNKWYNKKYTKPNYDITKPFNTGFAIGASVLADGTLQMDMTFRQWGGIGFESGPTDMGGIVYADYSGTMSLNKARNIFKDKELGDSYGVGTTMAVYLISPSYKGFNAQVGFGSFTQTKYSNFYDETEILGNNGGYSIASGGLTKSYYTVAVAKTYPIWKMQGNPFISVEGKYLYRRYSDGAWNTTAGLGLKIHL